MFRRAVSNFSVKKVVIPAGVPILKFTAPNPEEVPQAALDAVFFPVNFAKKAPKKQVTANKLPTVQVSAPIFECSEADIPSFEDEFESAAEFDTVVADATATEVETAAPEIASAVEDNAVLTAQAEVPSEAVESDIAVAEAVTEAAAVMSESPTEFSAEPSEVESTFAAAEPEVPVAAPEDESMEAVEAVPVATAVQDETVTAQCIEEPSAFTSVDSESSATVEETSAVAADAAAAPEEEESIGNLVFKPMF